MCNRQPLYRIFSFTPRVQVLELFFCQASTSMSYNPFHAKTVDAAEQRPAADVFRLSVQASDAAISSRFASGGKYTIEQLEAGADEAAPAPAEASEFDPDDKRSLYERLKAQKDAKQEEFEHRNAFKNQMCALATAATCIFDRPQGSPHPLPLLCCDSGIIGSSTTTMPPLRTSGVSASSSSSKSRHGCTRRAPSSIGWRAQRNKRSPSRPSPSPRLCRASGRDAPVRRSESCPQSPPGR